MSELSPGTSPANLILDRFCGREIYPITLARWNLYRDEELEMMNLCISLHAGYGTLLRDDTKTLAARPWWEIDILQAELSLASLIHGTVFSVPDGYDETMGGHVTNFYYCEHEGTENNVVEILSVDGTRLLLRMTGETIDVNFYDGSKPPTRLLVEAWFTHDSKLERSMQ